MNRLARDLEAIAASTSELWEELRGQHLFLTGGTGFFGCWLAESFCYVNRVFDLGARLTILTRNPAAFIQKCPHLASDSSIDLLTGDVRNFAFPSGDFPFVIHAATEASARQAAEEPLEMLSTIVNGTERTLQFAATHGTRKFLLTSSGAIYGKQPSHLFNVPETYAGAPDPLRLDSLYGEGKRLAELLCAVYGSERHLECKIARCWAFCGPYLPLDRHFAIGNFIGDALAGRPIQIHGDGTPRRSYLYAADLAIWMWTILFRAPALVPFNVGSEVDVSILELARTVLRVLAPNLEIRVAEDAVPATMPARYVPAVGRAQELLGLSPSVDLEEAIRRTAGWHCAYA